MIDLTKVDKPFGELDQVTQWALMGAAVSGKQIEYQTDSGGNWEDVHATWEGDEVYRLKSEPVVHSASWPMGASAFEHFAPMLSDNQATWAQGTATVTMIDGEPTRIVWEANQ